MIDKTLTIGTEIEMTGLTRKHAAEAVAKALGVGRSKTEHYGGAYDAWHVTASDGRIWKLMRDSSIAQEDGSDTVGYRGYNDLKVELVTPILHYEDIEPLQEVVRALRAAGAKTNGSCGIHVHVGADKFNGRTLRNLVNIWYSKEDLIYKALNVLPRRQSYCKKMEENFLQHANEHVPTCVSDLLNTWYTYNGDGALWDRDSHYNSSRYHALNLHATNTKGTVEFRVFNSTLHAGKVKAYIQFCVAVASQALAQKSASPKKTETTNPKYTFRTWLLRLGLIGDEYATCRKHLLANLTGDIAFRNGRRAA